LSSLSDEALAGVVIGVIAVVSITVIVILVLNGVIQLTSFQSSAGVKTKLLDPGVSNPFSDRL
jgi:alanine-alpha-ketoisovalerate/valine-pyruvate aminotransferase